MKDLFRTIIEDHINFDISNRGYSPLLERLGYPEQVLEFTKSFIEAVIPQISNTTEGKPTKLHYTNKNINSTIPFMEDFDVELELSIEDGEVDSTGGLSDLYSTMYLKDDKLYIHPVIHIRCHAETRIELKYEFFKTIGHEFTHAYSEYMMLKSKSNIIKPLLRLCGDEVNLVTLFLSVGDKTEKSYYNNNIILDNPTGTFEEIFSRMYYKMSEPERRAQMSELRHELDKFRYKIKDSKTAAESLINSTAYNSNYKWLNDSFDEFSNIIIKPGYEILHKSVKRAFNKVFGKNYNDIPSIIRHLYVLIDDYNKFFINRSGKVLQDIIDSNMAAGTYSPKSNVGIKESVEEILELEV